MAAAGSGMFVGCWLTLIFAAYMSTMSPTARRPSIAGLVDLSPDWYVVFHHRRAAGRLREGSLCLYGAGLDTSSLVPRLPRVPATLVVSALTVAFVYVGVSCSMPSTRCPRSS